MCFHLLQLNTLRRFKRHYRVTTRPNLSKQQMVDVSTWIYYFYIMDLFYLGMLPRVSEKRMVIFQTSKMICIYSP